MCLLRQDVRKVMCCGLKSFRRPPKVTQAYTLPDNAERCPERLYIFYNSRCPDYNRPENAFYRIPLIKWSSTVWFSTAPLWINTLSNVIRRLCQQAGFQGFFTNHSLRATAAAGLFEADVDEQLIKTSAPTRYPA